MLKDILPELIFNAVSGLKYDRLCEIRIRVNKPITVNYLNSYYYLGETGVVNKISEAIEGSKVIIDTILHRASNYSLYAVNEQLKSGFLTVSGGIRIGLSGTVVVEDNKTITIKDLSAINIRIPHQIFGSSLNAFNHLFNGSDFLNTLIVSCPGAGKTTFIRDICFQLSEQNFPFNILLLDERSEIASCVGGEPQLDVGKFTDIMTGGTKTNGFLNGIRSLSPNIICTDEIGTEEDVKAIEYAISCGVNIIATIHAKDILELQKKTALKHLFESKAFKRYVVLSNMKGKGTIEGLYDENFNEIMRN